MDTSDSSEEMRVLNELLADAHARIRELRSRLDQVADELLTLKLNDRRAGTHGKVGRERRRSGVRVAELRMEHQGHAETLNR